MLSDFALACRSGSVSFAITHKVFAKEDNNARVEVTVKDCPVEAGRIGT